MKDLEKTIYDENIVNKNESNDVVDETSRFDDSTSKKDDSQSEPKESQSERKRFSWKTVTVGSLGAIVFGGTGALLASFTGNETVTVVPDSNMDYDDENVPEEENHPDWVDDSIPVAHSVTDDMSFAEAFSAARNEVGAGGVFEWHGNLYGTYTAEEWNSMSSAEHAEYGSHFNWGNYTHDNSDNTHENDNAEQTPGIVDNNHGETQDSQIGNNSGPTPPTPPTSPTQSNTTPTDGSSENEDVTIHESADGPQPSGGNNQVDVEPIYTTSENSTNSQQAQTIGGTDEVVAQPYEQNEAVANNNHDGVNSSSEVNTDDDIEAQQLSGNPIENLSHNTDSDGNESDDIEGESIDDDLEILGTIPNSVPEPDAVLINTDPEDDMNDGSDAFGYEAPPVTDETGDQSYIMPDYVNDAEVYDV